MKRIFSGVQPSGRLHIGNYLGAIKSWIKLQDKYKCIYGIVDYHAMTIKYSPDDMQKRVLDCATSYLAIGLDPKKSSLMIQSAVKEHTELAWILNTITPISWLTRVPTYKEKSSQHPDDLNIGLLDYPVLMAADIILYKADAVPVGEDQLSHLELTREIVRRFNYRFGRVFPEPKSILSSGARIMGLDGKSKMSKSLNNCIYLDDTPDDIRKKLARAVTDPQRQRRNDAGNPDVCNIFSLHKLFSISEEIERVNKECRTAEIGCVECKKILAKNMSNDLTPIREKKLELNKDIDYVKDVLLAGIKESKIIAMETMEEIKQKIGVKYTFL